MWHTGLCNAIVCVCVFVWPVTFDSPLKPPNNHPNQRTLIISRSQFDALIRSIAHALISLMMVHRNDNCMWMHGQSAHSPMLWHNGTLNFVYWTAIIEVFPQSDREYKLKGRAVFVVRPEINLVATSQCAYHALNHNAAYLIDRLPLPLNISTILDVI